MSEPADPFDEPAYDPLDEEFEPDVAFVRGGSDPEEGSIVTGAETRKRMARILSSQRSIGHSVTPERTRAYLASLSGSGIKTVACAAAGWHPNTPSQLAKRDKVFKEAERLAMSTFNDHLEQELMRRALHGVHEEHWRLDKEGNPVLTHVTTKYSDALIVAALKAKKPADYRESYKVDHSTGSKGGVLLLPAPVPLSEWTAQAAIQQAKYRERQEDGQT